VAGVRGGMGGGCCGTANAEVRDWRALECPRRGGGLDVRP
jgi:hypothetical protein